MMRKNLVLSFIVCLYLFPFQSQAETGELVPMNLFNIGDSIGEAEAIDNVVGSHHHDKVWSTGYNRSDIISSFSERFEDICPERFQGNNGVMDRFFNRAISGSTMSDFPDQAWEIVNTVGQITAGQAGMIAIYLGNNDVCSDNFDSMTSAAAFERDFRAGLDILAASAATRDAVIHVSSIPAIYWLWYALHNDSWCRIAWQFVPCQNILGNPVNDCGANGSSLDPDTIQGDDGPDCRRRKTVHARIRDIYNPILKNVLAEYLRYGRLTNGYYNDIFSIRFQAGHINSGDCFHPSVQGQAILADSQWQESIWSSSAPVCSDEPDLPLSLPWLHLLLSH